MGRTIWTYFPTYIARADLDEEPYFEEIQQELKQAIEKETLEYNDGWGKTHKLSDPTFGNRLFSRLKKFPSIVKNEIIQYMLGIGEGLGTPVDEAGKERLVTHMNITASWVTKLDNNDFAHTHNHLPSHFSGVYYYQYPSNNETGKFTINTPVSGHWGLPLHGWVPSYTIDNIRTGTLLLFPSYLEHGVRRYQGDEPRISVSFNARMKDAFEHCESITE